MSMRVSGAKAGRVPLSCRMIGACVLGACLVLTGCAGTAPAQLTTFNRLEGRPAGLQGLRFMVEPQPGQVDSLAFADYAERVRKALGQHGLVPVSDSRQADLVVHIDYRSDGDPSAGNSSGSRISLGLGGGTNLGWGIGLGLPVEGRSDGIQYRHRLQVVMDRVPAGQGGGVQEPRRSPERVYESTLVTTSESAAVAPLMPAMIDAIFAHFPGDNGKTVAVSLSAS